MDGREYVITNLRRGQTKRRIDFLEKDFSLDWR